MLSSVRAGNATVLGSSRPRVSRPGGPATDQRFLPWARGAHLERQWGEMGVGCPDGQPGVSLLASWNHPDSQQLGDTLYHEHS